MGTGGVGPGGSIARADAVLRDSGIGVSAERDDIWTV
jgi:hypothetical protein